MASATRGFATIAASAVIAMGCGRDAPTDSAAPPASTAEVVEAPPEPPPPPPEPQPLPKRRCPPEMMLAGDRTCVDMWEASLVDKRTGTELSPYYPPVRALAVKLRTEWETKRRTLGSERARAVPLPPLTYFQRTNDVEPMAVSKPGVVPNGYLSGIVAEAACENAGKRLCEADEWIEACEGQLKRPFPYGDKYEAGRCNVFRAAHPAAELHDDLTVGHLDPRLNLVTERGKPLLLKTGEAATCASAWGDDAAYDMNGNLDEWIAHPTGRFVGGFFSRSTKSGCRASVSAHPRAYLDYSLGVRCCKDPDPG